MKKDAFDYEDVFMGVREKKPDTYVRTFNDDYRMRSLTQAISLKKGTLLDIGCGGGIFTESLPHYYPRVNIYGCDVSKKAIAYAKKLGSGNVSYKVMKGKKLPYTSNSFDVCLCLDVLEHVPDADYFLKEIRRVLKKDGRLYVIVPCEGQPLTYTWIFQKLGVAKYLTKRYFGHIHPEFTYGYVLNLLRKHGYLIEQTKYSEHWFYQLSHLTIFFVPKLLLEHVLGKKKAHEFDNSSLISAPKQSFHPLMLIRSIWSIIFNFMMMYPMSWETILMQDVPIGAWKLHVVAKSHET